MTLCNRTTLCRADKIISLSICALVLCLRLYEPPGLAVGEWAAPAIRGPPVFSGGGPEGFAMSAVCKLGAVGELQAQLLGAVRQHLQVE